VITDLQSKGIATLFVSHKLDEVLQIAQRITVLRDGMKIGVYPSGELSSEKLTFLMTGKKLDYSQFEYSPQADQPLLEVLGLNKSGNFKEINFRLLPGEIIGITGLLGSGRTELAQCLFGMMEPDSGEIRIRGKAVRIRSVQEAIDMGIGYVPENRLLQGLVMEQSVGKNVVITIIEKILGALRLIDPRKKQESIGHWIEELSIRIPSVESPVQTLSGGNQQRVVVAKWIATDPKILILDGPTVGIDVAAKSAIHEIIRKLAREGMGIIIISDEVAEVLHNCNRIMVMHKGRLVDEFPAAETSEEEVQSCVDTVR
jgi:simple sugar transport system ATP-binding protein